MHAVDDVERAEPGMLDLQRLEVLRNDADDMAARLERGVRDDAHQAYSPAAIDELQASVGYLPPEARSRLPEILRDPQGGAAVDADRTDIGHRLDSLGKMSGTLGARPFQRSRSEAHTSELQSLMRI